MPTVSNLIYGAGQRLFEARNYLNLDQKEFAALLGLSLSQLGKMERDERPINPAKLKALEEKGINVEYIKTGEGRVKSGVNVGRLNELIEKLSPENQNLIASLINTMLENQS